MKENGKHVKSWLAKAVFGCSLLLGAAQTWALSCSGNIYVADPGWSSFQMVVDGGFNLIPSTSLSDGWYVIKANSVGSQHAKDFFFAASDWNGFGITKSQYNVTGWNQSDKISCSDFGTSESLYIYEDPTTAGKTVISSDPPNAKYF